MGAGKNPWAGLVRGDRLCGLSGPRSRFWDPGCTALTKVLGPIGKLPGEGSETSCVYEGQISNASDPVENKDKNHSVLLKKNKNNQAAHPGWPHAGLWPPFTDIVLCGAPPGRSTALGVLPEGSLAHAEDPVHTGGGELHGDERGRVGDWGGWGSS